MENKKIEEETKEKKNNRYIIFAISIGILLIYHIIILFASSIEKGIRFFSGIAIIVGVISFILILYKKSPKSFYWAFPIIILLTII